MSDALAPAADVRHNQTLSYEELREEAAAAVEASGLSKAEVGRRLGYKRAYITRATTEAGSHVSKVQGEIIALLTRYRVEEEATVSFRVLRAS